MFFLIFNFLSKYLYIIINYDWRLKTIFKNIHFTAFKDFLCVENFSLFYLSFIWIWPT